MQQNSFTLLGFTQPHTAMLIIENIENNAKGFTSRLLWYFPNPVFCQYRQTILDSDERDEIEKFEENLGEFYLQVLNVMITKRW